MQVPLCKILWDSILLTGYKTAVNGIAEEEKLSRSTGENITRWKMWFLSTGYDFKQTLFSWRLNANFKKYHVVCAQVSGQDINLSKGKDKRDTLLLVIGHGCLLCSFPWKIALGKAGYFQHCISDLDKHLRIHQGVGISLYESEIQNVHQWDEALEQPYGGLLLLWNFDPRSLETVTRHSEPVSLHILPVLKQVCLEL